MTSIGQRKLGLYILVALSAVLLAPYAGCHVFTQQPALHQTSAIVRSTEMTQDSEQENTSTVDSPSPPHKSRGEDLSEIEELLRK